MQHPQHKSLSSVYLLPGETGQLW